MLRGIETVVEFDTVDALIAWLPSGRPDLIIVDCTLITRNVAAFEENIQQHAEGAAILFFSDVPGVPPLPSAVGPIVDRRRCTVRMFLDLVSEALTAKLGRAFSPIDVSSLVRVLTPRQREVLSYLAAGADNLKIAAHLGVCERTVKGHVTNLYRKLGQENRAQLALLAREAGLLPRGGP